MTTETPASVNKKAEIAPQKQGQFWYRLKRLFKHTTHACSTSMWFLVRALVVVYFIFCGLLLGLRYLVLPNVVNYKPEIEKMMGQALGRDLHIASLQASWHGLNPRLELKNVVLLDRQGQPALTLPEVNTTLSWLSFAVADLRFQTIEINQPDLDVARDANGKLYVAGFLVETNEVKSQKNEGKGLDWLLSQHQIMTTY